MIVSAQLIVINDKLRGNRASETVLNINSFLTKATDGNGWVVKNKNVVLITGRFLSPSTKDIFYVNKWQLITLGNIILNGRIYISVDNKSPIKKLPGRYIAINI